MSSPDEWSVFATHLEEFRRSDSFFHSFKIRHIPKATNLRADKLPRGAQSSPTIVFYVDLIPLV